MKRLSFLMYAFLFLGIGKGKAQYTDLLNFNVSNGAYPSTSLLQSGKKIYGMTQKGGAHDKGCIFSLDTIGGGYKDMNDFNGTNGAEPIGSLMLFGKKLYGMTEYGGANSVGCIFSIDTNGNNYKDIFDFNVTNGKWPLGDLTVSNNTLYGMVQYGGANNLGCIFAVDTNGSNYRDFFDFSGTNGAYPSGSLTIIGSKIFGMTTYGGSTTGGVIFRIDSGGTNYTVLYTFDIPVGENPAGTLTPSASKNVLYGMTENDGGITGGGTIFSVDTDGTHFKDLDIFNLTNYGDFPFYGCLALSGKVLYGMTYRGGSAHVGIVFSIDTNGSSYKEMLDFNGINGGNPIGSVILAGNVLYGMAQFGGTMDSGVIFKLDTSAIASINNLTSGSGSINIYPNPSNGIYTIVAKNEELRGTSIEVYNMLGEKVYSQLSTFNSQLSINLSNQPSGVYLYRVIGDSGELIGEGKLIIQK